MATHQAPPLGEPCPTCSGLFSTPAALQALTSKAGYAHLSGAEVKQTAAAGCPMCQRLVNVLTGGTARETDRLVFWADFKGKRCQATVEENCTWAVKVSHPYEFDEISGRAHRDGVNQNWGTSFKVFAEYDGGAAPWIPNRPVVTHVGSEYALNTAWLWLETCLQTHPSCSRPETPLLPTRVVDIEVVGGQGDDHVKLHISAPSERNGYAVLSYCWGGPQPVLLTTTNLADMVQGISLDRLPQTIQDAIKVTRRLGIRFLWIDALCIIQEGDDSDKLAEVNAMGQVYKNATITIAAGSALAVSEGFLHTRAAPVSFPLPFYCGPEREMGAVQLIWCADTSCDNMKPLNTRGWTLQEELLSRRVLAYGAREQVWRCQTEASKQFPGSPLTSFQGRAILPRDVFEAAQPFTPAAAHSLWSSVVNAYTSRQLSFREDRLAAVAGVIAELKPLFQDECTFGIWNKNFVRQLAWMRSDARSEGDEDVVSCAPAWSWASRLFGTHFMSFEPVREDGWMVAPDNALVLTGLLRRGHDVPRSERGSWRFNWDIRSPELTEWQFVTDYRGKDVFYFLLGYEDGREYRKLSMVLVPDEQPQIFRRIGLVYNYLETTTFDAGEVSRVTLLP